MIDEVNIEDRRSPGDGVLVLLRNNPLYWNLQS
jgi:hypothetical protein